jgi:uncharacterized damage-inducible protein DinB
MKDAFKNQVLATKDWFDRSTRVLEEADSCFAPAEGMFTVSQQVAHAAQTFEWFVGGAFNPSGFDLDFEAMDKAIKSCTSLTAARAWMDRAVATTLAGLEEHSEAEWMAPLPEGPIMGGQPKMHIFGAIMDHTAHHRGALTVYSRLLGKVPLMPYMEA